MVDKTPNTLMTQLPTATHADYLYMYGSLSDFIAAVKEQLDEVPMNPLEIGLLDRFLATP